MIVCGETGSGKTTQLPKICLALGRGLGAGGTGLIGHTQPRRIAARRPAARIAEELGTPFGEVVGFKVRFHRQPVARRIGQADDRRHPARRNADRSAARRLRHDHHRRSARAQPEHRFPARLSEANPAAAARSEADRDLGDDRRRPLRAPFRQRRQAGAGDRSERAPVSGRGALPAGRGRQPGGEGGAGHVAAATPTPKTQRETIAT